MLKMLYECISSVKIDMNLLWESLGKTYGHKNFCYNQVEQIKRRNLALYLKSLKRKLQDAIYQHKCIKDIYKQAKELNNRPISARSKILTEIWEKPSYLKNHDFK